MMTINYPQAHLTIHPFFLRKKKERQLPQSQTAFEALLDELRPTADKVEVVYQHGERKDELGALIYTDGKLRHAIDVDRQNPEAFQEEVENLVKFYKHPPRLWPGCRGDIARKFELTMTVEFNKWFDNFANQNKDH